MEKSNFSELLYDQKYLTVGVSMLESLKKHAPEIKFLIQLWMKKHIGGK